MLDAGDGEDVAGGDVPDAQQQPLLHEPGPERPWRRRNRRPWDVPLNERRG